MSICSTNDRCLKQSVVLIYCHQSLNDECYETQVLLWSLAWSMQQHAIIRSKTPVVVLTTTIDSVERLLVKQYAEAMIASHALHQRHEQHVMVDSQITLLEDRSQLELVGCNLVVTCLTRNSQLQCLNLKILHKGLNTIRYGSEIMVVHLLVLGTLVSHQRTTGHNQVGTCRIQALVDQKILLFPTKINLHLFHIIVEVLAYLGSSLVDGMQRTKQWSLIVESLTSVGDEDSRDTKCIIDDEYRRCRIPGRIASSLEGVTDTTVRET